MNLSDLTGTIIGTIVCYKKKDGEMYAENVSELYFIWTGKKWQLTEIWTPHYPEVIGFKPIRPSDVREVILSAAVPCHAPDVPEKPEFDIGETISYDSGDGVETGVISKISMMVDENATSVRYDIDGEEDRESIDSEWIIRDSVQKRSEQIRNRINRAMKRAAMTMAGRAANNEETQVEVRARMLRILDHAMKLGWISQPQISSILPKTKERQCRHQSKKQKSSVSKEE